MQAARAPWWRGQKVRMVVLAGWIGVVLATVNTLLLRQLLDAPATFATWLGLCGLLGWLGLGVLRPPRAERPARPHPLGRWRVVWPACLLVLVFLFHYGSLGVTSDGRDYVAQVRSLVLDGDLDIEPAEIDAGGARGLARVYPVGSALLWAPFYAAGHAWLGVLNRFGADHPRDGYEAPYGVAVGLGTLSYGFVALVLIARVLGTYWSAPLAVATTLLVCVGSFLLWYLTVEPAMTHGTSLFAVTLFLYLWHQTRDDRTLRQWMTLGAAAGLMTMVRWQDGLFALVAGLDAGRDYVAVWRGRRPGRAATLVRRHAAFGAAALATLLPQLWLWYRNSSGWFALPSGEFRVHWLEPYVSNVLFSPNHGLMAWTPLVYLAVLGLVPFIARQPWVGGLLALGFLGQVYANSVLQGWWGGSAFGARRFAGCGLVFAVGLAALIEWGRARPLVAIGAVLTPLVVTNVALMQDVRQGRLPGGEGLTAGQMLGAAYARVGNPFSFPASAAFAWTHRVTPARYDELGRRLYHTLALDVGEPEDERFLTYGWSGPERDGSASFRWAVGREAGVVVPIRERVDYTLRLRAEPFAYPDAPAPLLDVVVNGQPVARVPLAPTMRDYDVALERRWLQPNLNHVAFRFAHAASPHALGLSDDRRELAVRFDTLRFARRVGPSTSSPW